MTPEVVEMLKAKYVEARKNFPNAEFMPWEAAPVGKTLYTETGREVVVTGQDLSETIPNKHGCPSCACRRPNDFIGWWIVKYGERDGFMEYPPMLHGSYPGPCVCGIKVGDNNRCPLHGTQEGKAAE